MGMLHILFILGFGRESGKATQPLSLLTAVQMKDYFNVTNVDDVTCAPSISCLHDEV
jgi:hypothetical protein